MARPGIAIGAAMFAAPIGVKRPVKAEIGRGDGVDHRPGALLRHLRAQEPHLFGQVPAIGHGLAPVTFEAAGRIACRPTGAQAQGRIGRWQDGGLGHGGRLEQTTNIFQ